MARGCIVVRRVVFVAPGELTTPTGGYIYDRRIVLGLRALGWRTDVVNLGDDFPLPSMKTRALVRTRLAALPRGDPIVVDGLALGALPEVARQLRVSHNLIALVHHPLALELGLSLSDTAALRMSEARALANVRRVIVTSACTARLIVSDYSVPAERVTIVQPGNDRVSQVRVSGESTIALLAVGAVVPRKGYDVLLAAVAALRDLPWRLTIVGDLSRDAATVARLQADIARFNLTDRVRVVGTVPAGRLATLYASTDIFVLASRFEGYGMAFSEAIAHGLPVVGTTAGAIPETVPAGAGLLAPPGDIRAFSVAVRRLIEDPAERSRLAEVARGAADMLPTWARSAERFSQAIETVR
jgi:glycosyltransferase involved in cell wall biosynthesis